MIANVYIDGFNFYYGCIKGTPHRWLNFSRLFTYIFKNVTINHIRYFTAKVSPTADDPSIHTRQLMYLRALGTLPNLSIHLGTFRSDSVPMRLVTPLPDGTDTATVRRTQEKGSDVNLASHLLLDGFRKDYEMAIIVTNDSDLVSPIQMVCNDLGLKAGILNPQKGFNNSLKNIPNLLFYIPIHSSALRKNQFPRVLTDSKGSFYKPKAW